MFYLIQEHRIHSYQKFCIHAWHNAYEEDAYLH